MREGHHYVPQYYLRGFCEDFRKGRIWVYDKQANTKIATQVKSVGKICNFYTPDLEKYLSKTEGEANPVVQKIRNRECLTLTDKKTLSIYIAETFKKVPRSKNRVGERAPLVARGLCADLHYGLDMAVAEDPSRGARAQLFKAGIAEILDRLAGEEEKIFHAIIPAGATPKTVCSIASLTWRFLTFDEAPVFLTCDNPVFIPRNGGLKRSGLYFPISSNIALLATPEGDARVVYLAVARKAVEETNGWIAGNTTRWVFHAKDEDWILPFIREERARPL